MPPVNAKRAALFWSKVDTSGSCWTWTGAVGTDKYGQFWDGETATRAHRFSYEMQYGPIPDGMLLMHLCDNRLCVHPWHLQPGTHAENMKDRDEKGRTLKGAKHGSARLDTATVKLIRHLAKEGAKQTDLSKRFGCSARTISHIVNGTTWK